jgi:hypothetical protein
MTVEDALRIAEDKAALLHWAADCAAESPGFPTSATYSGLGDACEEIGDMIRAIRQSLTVDALGTDLTQAGSKRRRD